MVTICEPHMVATSILYFYFEYPAFVGQLTLKEAPMRFDLGLIAALGVVTVLDAGIRLPRGIFTGNFMDLGNYHQCLAIHHSLKEGDINGKYCLLSIPLYQKNMSLPKIPLVTTFSEIPLVDLSWFRLDFKSSVSPELVRRLKLYQRLRFVKLSLAEKIDTSLYSDSENLFSGLSISVAVCLPKTCTAHEAVTKLLFNGLATGLEFKEDFCRLPNDKPWVTADTVALLFFGTIGILTLICTSYDIWYTILMERGPEKASKLLRTFSLYTNTRRLVTFTPSPGTIECLDGVRTLFMIWVIVGRTFISQLFGLMSNSLDAMKSMMSLQSIWLMAALITMDTFFLLSGLLLVYTTAGKVTRKYFFKNLHWFYLNRILRIFPLLGTVVLLQASVFNRIFDGPYWLGVSEQTNNCRLFWWSTLLHIQNYYNPSQICLPHSWYLAMDLQLHIISPVILFWVFSGRRRSAWLALLAGLVTNLTVATAFNFYMKFQSGIFVMSRLAEQPRYIVYYYMNTITRASPFFVGMIFGYILHLYRGQKVSMSKILATVLWISSIAISTMVIYSTYPIMQPDWDNEIMDVVLNSLVRPAWAFAVGWCIFACEHGYGGPVNWLLSLPAWKLLSRLSYAMYIVHFPLISIAYGMTLTPIHYSVEASLFRFLSDFMLAAIAGFLLTVFIDAPCSSLFKMLMKTDMPKEIQNGRNQQIQNGTKKEQ